MAWNSVEIYEQRVRFVVAANRREKSLRGLCEEFGISRPTGYLWLQRYREQGLAGMEERSRRPHVSPERTPAEEEQRVIAVRRRFPDWGARKLRVLLAAEGLGLPASTIHRILLRHGLVREADRHQHATQRFARATPNELWQMDFKSPIGWDTHVGPLSVLDDCSRYLTTLGATGSTRTELVREQLEETFQRCGVPQAMLMDHGTPWWNTRSPGGITWLGVWLMRQGIRLHWSGFRHPQTQGKVERFHGSLERAVKLRGLAEDRQAWLDAYRREYNEVRPHEALGMRTPASVWRKSDRRYEANPPRWEYAAEAEVRRIGSYGHLYVDGIRWDLSRALAGQWVELVRVESRILVYYCRTVICELDTEMHRSTAVDRCIPELSTM
jgi:transposase InsO family protein